MFVVCSMQYLISLTKLQVVQIVITCWTHAQGDIMPEWTPSKCACCPGSELASQWRGPLSLMIPVYSLSRWHCLLCFNDKKRIKKIHYAQTLCWRHIEQQFLLSSGFCRKRQKDQGALCLPWQRNAQVGQWTVLHSPAVGSCQNRVSLSPVRPEKQMHDCNEMWLTQKILDLQWWQWCDETTCMQTFSEQVDWCSEGTEWDQKQISNHSALCRRWNLAAERRVGDAPSRCHDALILVFLLTQNWLCFSLRSAHEQLDSYKRKLDTIDDYERQVCLLREEMTYLSTEKAMLQQR